MHLKMQITITLAATEFSTR